ncbi:MAG: NADH-quinone oxidoreductase subunit D [Deltaproteobacteria bacterium]|nr:NADH-quinone oxidoreductase subunit D [Deltaproteobacteria bacterium]
MNPPEILERLDAAFGPQTAVLRTETLDPFVEIPVGQLARAATFLRDEPELRFDTLRNLTGVDRKDAFEMVYHLYSMDARHGLTVKVRLDHDRPVADSVHAIWPAAEWHEREILDLLGVEFTGHPNPKRLFMPEDWVGHPLRKNYVRPEVYHGIPTSRDVGETVTREQTANHPTVQPAMHVQKTDEVVGFMRLNMGPHHPATHGVLNFLLETDGEILRRVIPDVGYLHRGIEKLAEMNAYLGTMPYTDRIDYLGAIFGNHAWALAVEKLAGVEVPPRGESCRVIASELNRIASHLIATGTIAMDLGAFTPFVHWIREREKINDIMERICGARLTYNYLRFGGVSRDIDAAIIDTILRWLDHFEIMIDEFNRLITTNEIFMKRLVNVAVISRDHAIAYALAGPNLRASGVDFDIRRDEPYSIYSQFDFDVVVGRGFEGTVGDSFDRFYCRILEMRESVKILRQACASIPEGETLTKTRALKPAANEIYTRVEGARGELGNYVVSDGTDKPYRMKIRTGSFTAMSIVESLSPGLMIADLVALIGSLDIVAPEVDR